MKFGERTLLCTLAGVVLCTVAQGARDDSSAGAPYQGIVDRNVFGLKPPPPPPDPEANKPPPPKMFLTGITTILGNKRALMKMTPPAKPGEPAKEQSFTLGEGQRDGDVEVLQIDEVAGTVKVNVYGSVTTLDFDNNGVKVASTPAPGAGPRPPGFVPKPGLPGFTPGATAPGSPAVRPLRLPTPGATSSSGYPGVTPVYAAGNPGYGNPAPNYGGAVPALAAGNAAIPLAGSTPAVAQPQNAADQANSGMTADQRFLLVEAYRAKLAQQGLTHTVPPIPATPFTSQLNPDAAGGTGAGTTPAAPGPPRAPSLPPLLPPTQ